MAMAGADFFAGALRIYLWGKGTLDPLQQDMAIKNIFFLCTFSGAYDMFHNSIARDWNSRDILTFPIVLRYPKRLQQLQFCRWGFAVSYLLIGILLSYILIKVSPDSNKWVANIILDIFLVAIFIRYFKNAHIKAVSDFI